MTLDTAAAKRTLRHETRRLLAALDASTRDQAAESLHQRILSLPEIEDAEGILCCLSFGVEIDTWQLVERLLESGKRVFVPRAELATRTLHLHPYPCRLEETDFGLRQPAEGEPELPATSFNETLDSALIAGLAFDRAGYRLGHGGGFFDRFLVDRPFPAVGLAFQLQIVDRLPTEEHDRAVHVVATERETIRPVR